MHTVADFTDQFYQFETSNRLFELTCDGEPFWDYIRFAVHEKLLSALNIRPELLFPSRVDQAGKLLRLTKEASSVLQASLKRRKLPSTHDIVVFDCDYKRLLNGRRVNWITYPVVQHLQGNFSILLLDPSALNDKQIDHYHCEFLSIRTDYLACRLTGKVQAIATKDRESLSALSKLIKNNFGIAIDILNYVRAIFLYQKHLKQRMKELLENVNPKLILFQNDGRRYYSVLAHELGIPSIELQHGATDILDVLSSYGKAPLPRNSIPDIILTFGQYWNRKFSTSAKLLDVGCPFIEKQLKNTIERKISRDPNRMLGISVMDHQLSAALYEFAKSAPDWTVYYKLRKEEYDSWRSLYPAEMQKCSNFIFIDNDNIPLLEYMSASEYIASTCSTALYEGIALGAKPIVYPGWGHEYVLDLVKDGLALYAAKPEDFIQIARNRSKPSSSKDPSFFFKPEALKNIEHEISALLSLSHDRILN